MTFHIKSTFGAAAIISDEHFDANVIGSSNCETIPKSPKSKEHISHPNGENLVLLVIKGPDMMALVHELYRRAADEA